MDEVNQELANQSKPPVSHTGKVAKFSPTSKSHKFLIIGLIVLLLLTAVSAAYMFSQNQSFRSQLGLPSFKFLRSHKTCTYNGQTYQSGEGFKSIDGCNSCSCTETGEVACTGMACEGNEVSQSNQTENWKIFRNQAYSFKHPVNWNVAATLEDNMPEEQKYVGDKIFIVNPEETVGIIVTTGEHSWGSTGQEIIQNSPISFSINGQDVQAEESVINTQSVRTSASISLKEKEYLILFGSGYPITDDPSASLDDYYRDKNTVLEILSTFEFTN